MHARYMDPRTCSFISVDPLVDNFISPKGERNLFGYGRANPVRYVDPTGMWNIDQELFYSEGRIVARAEEGDTLEGLAEQLGITVEEILDNNQKYKFSPSFLQRGFAEGDDIDLTFIFEESENQNFRGIYGAAQKTHRLYKRFVESGIGGDFLTTDIREYLPRDEWMQESCGESAMSMERGEGPFGVVEARFRNAMTWDIIVEEAYRDNIISREEADLFDMIMYKNSHGNYVHFATVFIRNQSGDIWTFQKSSSFLPFSFTLENKYTDPLGNYNLDVEYVEARVIQ